MPVNANTNSTLTITDKDIFNKLKNQLLMIDPVAFCENYLTLDGKPFRLHGNGYKPFADIYRYIGIKALEPNAKPVILVKGRQVGATTMASALEMYFMGSGLFGTGIKPAIRIIHTFPQLELAAAYSKTKLNQMIMSSIPSAGSEEKAKSAKPKSHMQSLLDQSTATNDSLHFKQFMGGNHLWVESTGLDADRIMGRTCDVIFFDECFPSNQKIATNAGKRTIGSLVNDFNKNKPLPEILTFNEKLEIFEYKKIINAWKKDKQELIELILCGKKIKCTKNHKFLTEFGWKEAQNIKVGTLIKAFVDTKYKVLESKQEKYNNGWLALDNIILNNEKKIVYDLEIEDNHNFVLSLNMYGKNIGGPIAHNCQKTTGTAIGNALKILTTAKYGKPSKGVQIFFGTPRRKGSDFHKMWVKSSQQYYYLGCEKCEEHFPLYTPGSDDWKSIWLYGYIVKCTKCGHEQDKRDAAERGKWVALKDPDDADCDMVGFHINQLYMPMFTKEAIENEFPGKHPINTERVFMNEVLGEFFQGESSPITPEEIREQCADVGRKFSPRIIPEINSANQQIAILGIDYGARADLEQMANPDKVKASGQSYSTAVVLLAKGPGLLSIEFCTKFKRNDIESKKGIIDQIMRQYSIQLAVGDIGYSNDFSEILHSSYGDRYLVSRAHNRVNDHVKFRSDAFPKEIIFERDHYIGELYEQMKKGMIRFPYGDFEKIAWLIEHCASMEIKPAISRGGDPSIHYVKGGTPNDGFMALLNAYIAYKFIITRGFTTNNPLIQQQNFKQRNKPLVLSGFINRKF